MLAILAQNDATLYLPAPDSTFAGEYDWVFYFIYYISVFFTLVITAAAVYFAVKYRRRADRTEGEHTSTHHTGLEMTWTIIPLIIVLAIFYFGFRNFMDMATPPGDAYKITVNSNRWNWTFIYPNGAITDTLYIPADRPVELTLTSADVIHSLFIPAFRAKKDAVPGRYNKMWFQANYDPDDDRIGPVLEGEGIDGEFTGLTLPLYCAEYCGQQHSQMLSTVVVLPVEQFRDAITQLAEPRGTPAEIGQRLTEIHGCAQCHAFEEADTAGTGPALYDLYGNPERSVQSDGTRREPTEEYIRESILYSGRSIVRGYRNEMPSFAGRLSDNEILAITEYFKSISTHYEGDLLEHLPGQEPAEDEGEGEQAAGETEPTEGDAPPAEEPEPADETVTEEPQ
ncbi:MAG: cytochrome c oxidase subunit II transmembrane domain-containing protein [Phycisphaeraceae bacterium]